MQEITNCGKHEDKIKMKSKRLTVIKVHNIKTM